MIIRRATEADIATLDALAAQAGDVFEDGYFARCMKEQDAGRRTVFIAFEDDKPAGYIQINWQPVYALFARLGIPEIEGLSVAPDFRRMGIGGRLMDHCEDVARKEGKTDIGIGVGLHAGFGSAQRLYIRKGFIPDGGGLVHDHVPVPVGARPLVDDYLALKLVKPL